MVSLLESTILLLALWLFERWIRIELRLFEHNEINGFIKTRGSELAWSVIGPFRMEIYLFLIILSLWRKLLKLRAQYRLNSDFKARNTTGNPGCYLRASIALHFDGCWISLLLFESHGGAGRGGGLVLLPSLSHVLDLWGGRWSWSLSLNCLSSESWCTWTLSDQDRFWALDLITQRP